MPVDPAFAQWLRDGVLYAVSTDAVFAAAWGSEASETDIISPLALLADANTEAARQQGFLEGPLVVDKHDVPGTRVDLLGRVVTIVADRLGYDAGVAVFVIGVEEQSDVRRTTLTVLRKQT